MPHQSTVSRLYPLAVSLALLGLAGCGGGGNGGNFVDTLNAAPTGSNGTNTDACSPAGQVQTVASVMELDYFWNDELEQRNKYAALNTADFRDVDDLLDFLRYRPNEFDRFFTFVTTVRSDTQFFGPGVFIGYGFGFSQDPDSGELWITQVYAGSPADAAGFARGLRINRVNGSTITQIAAAGGLDSIFGDEEIGVTQTFELLDANGAATTTTATKAEVTINPVPQFKVFDAGAKTIGYIEFGTFISTADARFDEVFAQFTAAGVTDIIVDVRYNGGGLVTIAESFGSRLAGPANIDRIFSLTRFNQLNSVFNLTTLVSAEPNAIDLDSIVFNYDG